MEFLDSQVAGLPVWHILVNSGAILLAAFMRSFTGFGFALIAVPALAFMLPPAAVVPVVLVLELITGAQLAPSTAKDWDRKIVRNLIVPALIGLPLGVYALQALDPDTMRLVLVGVLILSVILFGIAAKSENAGSSTGAAIVSGGASGALCGATGIPGPPVIAYVMGAKLEPAQQRATLVYYFLLIDAATLVAQFITGVPVMETVLQALLMAPALIVGNMVGTAAFNRWGGDAYKPVAFGMLLVIAAGLVVQVVSG